MSPENEEIEILETSAEINELAKVLPKAQAAMGEVFKTANNPAFRSKYADLASVVEAVVPALNSMGISLLQPIKVTDDGVSVATMLLHESGQWVRCTVKMPVMKRDAHGVGSASTYGRRYGLQAMSGVAPEDDDGNAAAKAAPPPKTPQAVQQPPTSAQAKRELTWDDVQAKFDGAMTEDELDKRYNWFLENNKIPMAWKINYEDAYERRRNEIIEMLAATFDPEHVVAAQ